jgi:hypothetical protein
VFLLFSIECCIFYSPKVSRDIAAGQTIAYLGRPRKGCFYFFFASSYAGFRGENH